MSSIIADLKKNSREIIRIDISEFKGKELINIRVWFDDMEGGYKPTQKGVALDISQYEELKNSILKIGEYLEDRKNGAAQAE
jgi:hypothetical protein